MKKALIYASVVSMVEMFNQNNIQILLDKGFEVEVACNFSYGQNITAKKIELFKEKLTKQGIKYHNVPIPRNLNNIGKIFKSYQITRKLASQENYNLVHCHSPIGSAICRLAFKDTNTRVIYTAHGFHFYDGAPKVNWALFYPIEKFLSKYTDDLIVINREDYNRAINFNAKRVHYVPGVGIDSSKVESENNISSLIDEFGDGLVSSFKIISVGELNTNKNQKIIIKALHYLQNPQIKYLICGVGSNKEDLESLVNKYGLERQVYFLGYRSDIYQLLHFADLFVFPSYREGLSVSLMEAKAAGLPAVVSNIRGNEDLITNGVDGFLVEPDDSISFAEKISELYTNKSLWRTMSKNTRSIIKFFTTEKIDQMMKNIYDSF